ncbi:MAG: transposase family protein [Akkermansia sp.]
MPDISAATLDRVLSRCKLQKQQERDATLQLSHFKKSIPFVDRTEKISTPGFLSVDTVAHGDGDMAGDFVWTLTVTDELTGWTQTRAIWNKGQYGTCCALDDILRRLPFRIRGINTDNGSEFINHHLQRFLREKYKICKVTRSRPNRKNDNARVEERNLHVVRECVGYQRVRMNI